MVPTDSTIKGAADLKGKTLAVKTGTSATDYAKEHFTETELRQFPNVDNAYLELQTGRVDAAMRSEEHTSELQSLMRISYAVFCLKKKNKTNNKHSHNTYNPQSNIM